MVSPLLDIRMKFTATIIWCVLVCGLALAAPTVKQATQLMQHHASTQSQPTNMVTFTAIPNSAHVWTAPTVNGPWTDSGSNSVVLTCSVGTQFGRAVDNSGVVLHWCNQTTNTYGQNVTIASDVIYQTSDTFPTGAFLTIPLPATNRAAVAVFGNTNCFWVSETDTLGDVSGNSSPVSYVATNPVIVIVTTNSP